MIKGLCPEIGTGRFLFDGAAYRPALPCTKTGGGAISNATKLRHACHASMACTNISKSIKRKIEKSASWVEQINGRSFPTNSDTPNPNFGTRV